MKALLASVAAALLVLVSCGGDDGGSGDDGGADTTDAAEELSSFETIEELNEALDAGGIECVLEYSGLRDEEKEISICTIEGAPANLSIWIDDTVFQEIVAPEGGEPVPNVAYGENWTVELTDAATAAAVAEAAGGTTTDG